MATRAEWRAPKKKTYLLHNAAKGKSHTVTNLAAISFERSSIIRYIVLSDTVVCFSMKLRVHGIANNV